MCALIGNPAAILASVKCNELAAFLRDHGQFAQHPVGHERVNEAWEKLVRIESLIDKIPGYWSDHGQ